MLAVETRDWQDMDPALEELLFGWKKLSPKRVKTNEGNTGFEQSNKSSILETQGTEWMTLGDSGDVRKEEKERTSIH